MRVRKTLLFLYVMSFLAVGQNMASTQDAKWVVKNPKWTEAHERTYTEFISRIYQARQEGKCTKNLATCLADPMINSFRNIDIAKVGSDASYFKGQDCGKCPFYLRAYVAYHLNLPFTYVSRVSPRGGKDFRYGRDGSIVRRRVRITTDDNFNPWSRYKGRGKPTFFRGVVGIHSGMHRFGPKNDWDQDSDFYSVGISKSELRPGLTWYEPNGHVAMVGDVQDDGDVYLFNCHADYTTTAEELTSEDYVKSRASQGGGFKAWRPYELINYSKDPRTGVLTGGEIRLSTNEELRAAGLYSSEQFDKPYKWEDREIPNFLDYVKTKLSGDLVKYDPVTVIEKGVTETCNAVKARISNVAASLLKGVDKNTMENSSSKGKLPENIYNTHHWEWEVYSSPSRDVAIKLQFQELYEKIQLMFELYDQQSPQLLYTSSKAQMKSEMSEAYYAAARECELVYYNSYDQAVEMDYLEFVKPVKGDKSRLFLMSFDPYHCAERRWGATSSNELSSCSQSSLKERWYRAQQNLRNQVFRDGERQDMDFSLRDLETKREKDGNGWDKTPNFDVTKLL